MSWFPEQSAPVPRPPAPTPGAPGGAPLDPLERARRQLADQLAKHGNLLQQSEQGQALQAELTRRVETMAQPWQRPPQQGQNPTQGTSAQPGADSAGRNPYGQNQAASNQAGQGRPGQNARAAQNPERAAAAGPPMTGLVVANVLLVLSTLAFIVWHLVTWSEPLVDAVAACGDAGGTLDCFTGDAMRTWVFLPLVAAIGAFGASAGARIETRQHRQRGYLLVLAGFALLALSLSTSFS
ncbi:hypothetical protein EXU48_06915 [Occultella glacieicola]|uniref:Integral membrane protein n=1 Tax=Occultella glacieicola TaxID=2518684 RepID=A0ABY2E5W0_9MICO|nr:hypothetical protein [Occultella glacieicola]TDE95972.1 hypothetical protein EXU48_06915 [Occultella glacieicola]